VILSEPGFAYAKEEGETALGLDGEKVLSPESFESVFLRVIQRVLGELFTLRAISNGINIGPKITQNNFPNHTTAPTLRSGSGYTLPNNR
jgi:hypothetical protein